MEFTPHRPQSMLGRAAPPAVLVAYVWVGLQLLLLVALRVMLLFPTTPGPSVGEFLSQMFSSSPAPAPALGLGLLIVNTLFIGLIGLNWKSLVSDSRWGKLLSLLVSVAAVALLAIVQWNWLVLLKSAF